MYSLYTNMWIGGRAVMMLDLRSTGRGFESWPTRCRVQLASLVKLLTKHKQVPANGRWCLEAGKVMSRSCITLATRHRHTDSRPIRSLTFTQIWPKIRYRKPRVTDSNCLCTSLQFSICLFLYTGTILVANFTIYTVPVYARAFRFAIRIDSPIHFKRIDSNRFVLRKIGLSIH